MQMQMLEITTKTDEFIVSTNSFTFLATKPESILCLVKPEGRETIRDVTSIRFLNSQNCRICGERTISADQRLCLQCQKMFDNWYSQVRELEERNQKIWQTCPKL